MNELVFFLEEESARALLEQIFPSLIPEGSQMHPRFIVFEGKQDLQKQLYKKLRGYENPKARFIVLRDQDQTNCRKRRKSLWTFASRLAVRKPWSASLAVSWRLSTSVIFSRSSRGWTSAVLRRSRTRRSFEIPIR
jgi:hypothetical protein